MTAPGNNDFVEDPTFQQTGFGLRRQIPYNPETMRISDA
jgi:hypothetical protein